MERDEVYNEYTCTRYNIGIYHMILCLDEQEVVSQYGGMLHP